MKINMVIMNTILRTIVAIVVTYSLRIPILFSGKDIKNWSSQINKFETKLVLEKPRNQSSHIKLKVNV